MDAETRMKTYTRECLIRRFTVEHHADWKIAQVERLMAKADKNGETGDYPNVISNGDGTYSTNY